MSTSFAPFYSPGSGWVVSAQLLIMLRLIQGWFVSIAVSAMFLHDFSEARPSPLLDLSYEFSNRTPTYPFHKKFEIMNSKWVEMSPGVKYKTQDFATSEHAGTHMDSPLHFGNSLMAIDDIPIDHFTGPAVVINITAKVTNNKDAMVEMADVEAWERQYGRIPNGSIIIMYSGWGRYWQNSTAYYGSSDIDHMHFPGFHADVCKWLAAERSVAGVGVDTLSLDQGASTTFPCHLAVSAGDIYGLENIANVEKLPPKGAIIRAFPMKIKGGTGAPTRIIAALNEPRQII